jgi:GNAT superfamily N-acetyltransferase
MRRTSLRDVIEDLRRTPLALVVQKVLRRVPFKPVDFARLSFLRFEGVPRVPVALLRGCAAVRRATPDDLEGLEQLQRRAGKFQKRFANGDRCVVAVVNDRIVGYEWFCDQAMHHETAWGVPIPIPAGFVYAYDAYIDPAHRNTGVWLRFKAHLGEWMIATGKQGVLTFVEDGNLPSLRTHLRFGFKPDYTVLAIKVMGVKFHRRFSEPMPSDLVAYRSNRRLARILRGSEL